MKKLFRVDDVAPLLIEHGYNGCGGGTDDAGDPLPTRLKSVDFHDDCAGDCGAASTFTLTFMDPQDDRFYQVTCGYDKDSCDGQWFGLKSKDGTDVDVFQVIDLPEEIPGQPIWGRYRGILEGDMIECTRVEKRQVTVNRWEEV